MVIFKENIQINTNEIQDRKVMLASKPIKLNVVFTTKCNLFCLMCEVRKITWQIPPNIVSEIISLFPYLQEIIWQGGEVFLLDYFRELLEEASRYPNLRHEITTNGHLIDAEWLKILGRVDLSLNISIDGVTKETYEYIRKGSKFEDLIRALKLINEVQKNGTGKRLVLVLIVTVMKSNHIELERVLEFAGKFKFDRVLLQPVKSNLENGENIFSLKDQKALRHINEVKEKMKVEAINHNIELEEWLPTSLGGDINISHAEIGGGQVVNDKGNGLFCYAPWQQMFIEWGGNVYPHCHCIQEGLNEAKVIGHVLQENLSQIWNGEKMQSFRTKILNNDYLNLCNPDCLNGLISAGMRNIALKA